MRLFYFELKYFFMRWLDGIVYGTQASGNLSYSPLNYEFPYIEVSLNIFRVLMASLTTLFFHLPQFLMEHHGQVSMIHLIMRFF